MLKAHRRRRSGSSGCRLSVQRLLPPVARAASADQSHTAASGKALPQAGRAAPALRGDGHARDTRCHAPSRRPYGPAFSVERVHAGAPAHTRWLQHPLPPGPSPHDTQACPCLPPRREDQTGRQIPSLAVTQRAGAGFRRRRRYGRIMRVAVQPVLPCDNATQRGPPTERCVRSARPGLIFRKRLPGSSPAILQAFARPRTVLVFRPSDYDSLSVGVGYDFAILARA
jgi:hypothetical protein